ncbi:MAG: hypothetical protein COA70_09105 [Planctomycetota bacterium]|nr:MAG: hypothetical protein COA70_09105 [Planctomycetota bacterium]
MTNRREVEQIWSKLEWIQDHGEVPFPFYVEECKALALAQKRWMEPFARNSALKIAEFVGDDRSVYQDHPFAGVISAADAILVN